MTLEYTGVNISGLEFGKGDRLWYDYAMPGKNYYDYWAQDVGSTIVRIPFKWQRLQSEPDGKINEDYFNLIKDSVQHAQDNGMTAILDMHNYGKFNGDRIDKGNVSVDSYSNVWRQIASEFNGQDDVWLNLMNEPFGYDAKHWADITQQVVNDLRDDGVDNKLLLSGTKWSGVATWYGSGNAEAYSDFVDPLDNFAFDVHQYLDEYSTGSNDSYVEGNTVERFESATNWAKEHGFDLFLGEIGIGDDAGYQAEMADLFEFMEANADVWLGWTLWGSGPWWSDNYHFNINPDGIKTGDIEHDVAIQAIMEYFYPNRPVDISAKDHLLESFSDKDFIEGSLGDDSLVSEKPLVTETTDRVFQNDIADNFSVNPDNFKVSTDMTVTLTLADVRAGYKNSIGFYEVAADGTIQGVSMAIEKAVRSDAGLQKSYDLSATEASAFGMFLVSNGYNKNDAYEDIDLSSLRFVYNLGQADERLAKVTDVSDNVSLVSVNGTEVTSLN